MIELSPSWVQWLLLTSSKPVSFILLLVAAALFIWLTAGYSKSQDSSSLLKIGLPAIGLIAITMLLPSVSPLESFTNQVQSEISSTAKLSDVSIANIEISSVTPLGDGSLKFVGIGKNSDNNVVQFSYTQYEHFGIYETIGFERNIGKNATDALKMPESTK